MLHLVMCECNFQPQMRRMVRNDVVKISRVEICSSREDNDSPTRIINQSHRLQSVKANMWSMCVKRAPYSYFEYVFEDRCVDIGINRAHKLRSFATIAYLISRDFFYIKLLPLINDEYMELLSIFFLTGNL